MLSYATLSQKPFTSSVTVLIVGFILYWIGPHIIRWMSTHALLTPAQRILHKKDLEKRRKTLTELFVSVWRIIIIVSTLYIVLTSFVKPEVLTPIFASAGIFGVALGFGAQSLIKDFLSGIFIISENQYRVGDVVEIEGFGGTVERIGVRSTVLRDVDGNVHYFPNGLVQHVINKTMDYSMARFVLSVAPETDIDYVVSLINKIGIDMIQEDPWKKKIIEPPQFVMMSEFTATSIDLIISGKTQPSDQWSVVAEIRRRILTVFEKEQIQLGTTPFVTQQVKKSKKN